MKFKKQKSLLPEQTAVRMVTTGQPEKRITHKGEVRDTKENTGTKREVFYKTEDIPEAYDRMSVVKVTPVSLSVPVQPELEMTATAKDAEGKSTRAQSRQKRKMISGVEIVVEESPKPMTKKEKKKAKKARKKAKYSIDNIEKDVMSWQ